MHIRKLYIHGFKSFPDKTNFVFEPGVSGIVGPNGCGKSNVVDAVKWCLGEQSAKSMRGASMSDVIFNGTQKRSPLKMAEVALTFAKGEKDFPGDYAHYDEIQISRRLFRNGSSEYLINQVKVRLRDIHDLFLDTGLTNRLYSFIEQGQIGEIVNARPAKTRELLEEAAGISRFKSKKEATLGKLDAATENLRQVSIIVMEQEKRLKQIERQVRDAIRYYRLKSRIKQLDIAVSFGRYLGLVSDRKSVAEELRQAELKKTSIEKMVSRQEALLYQVRQNLRSFQERVNQLRDESAEVEANRREYESVLTLQARECEERSERVKLLVKRQQEMQTYQKQRQHEYERLETLQVQSTEQEQQYSNSYQEALQKSRESTESITKIDQAIERQNKALLTCKSTLATTKAQNQASIKRLQDVRNSLTKLSSERGRLSQNLDKITTECQLAQQKLEQAQKQLQTQNERQSAFNEEVRQVRIEVEKGLVRAKQEAGKLKQLSQQYTQHHTRLQTLQQLQDAHEGVDSGHQELLQQPGVLGLLAEHLDVPEHVEPLLATVLGEQLDLLLLSPETDIATLCRKNKGRSIFLQLTGEPPLPLPRFATEIGGTTAGKQALGVLLRDIDDAPDIEAALRLQHSTGKPCLSLSPIALVSRLGTISMGRPKSTSGVLLERRRQIKKLTKLVQDAADALANQQRIVTTADTATDSLEKELRRKKQEGESIRASLGDARVALRSAESSLKSLQREQQQFKSIQGHLHHQSEELQQEEKKLHEQAELLQKHSIALSKDEREVTESVLALQKQREQERQVAQQRSRKKHSLNAELVGIRERVSATKRELQQMKVQLAEDEKRRLQNREDQQTNNQRIQFLSIENHSIEKELKELAVHQEKLRKALTEAQLRYDAVAVELKKIEDSHSDIYLQKEKISLHYVRQEELHTRIKEDLFQCKNHLHEQHQFPAPRMHTQLIRVGHLVLAVDPQALQMPVSEEDQQWVEEMRVFTATLESHEQLEAWSAEHVQLVEQYKKIGNVNLMAIEERAAITEEYESLLQQQTDLQESFDQIRQTIQRLDQICIERFRHTFDAVNQNFKQIYPRLVGGGQAKLALLDPMSLLDTGVLIYAQPPGKKLQNLNLLSGGEKAMVAISLLFSLFRVKPSPFCLLDEVDAPLDEGNGARFNVMLSEMAEKSQFIVITHNKKTMEAVDVLYGVSMPSPGVSRLVDAILV